MEVFTMVAVIVVAGVAGTMYRNYVKMRIAERKQQRPAYRRTYKSGWHVLRCGSPR